MGFVQVWGFFVLFFFCTVVGLDYCILVRYADVYSPVICGEKKTSVEVFGGGGLHFFLRIELLNFE